MATDTMKRVVKKMMAVSLILVLISRSGVIWAAPSTGITTVSITKNTIAALPSCLHYRIVGVCFWLVCNFGCSVATTLKVDHYLPDVVITTYPEFGTDPWVEMNKTLDKVSYKTGNKIYSALNAGMEIKKGAMNSADSSDGDIRLEEVNVIGNPAVAGISNRSLLTGQAVPLLPYYQSQLDSAEWRSGLAEQFYPEAWIPGKDDVGTFLINEWGAVYPRQAFIMQPNVGKASTVIAVRGGNIATTPAFNHLAQNLAAAPCPEQDCTTAGPILSDAPKTQWQMLRPETQTTCQAKIDYEVRPSWIEHQPDDQTYAWVVWREYRGCINGPGQYLGSVGG